MEVWAGALAAARVARRPGENPGFSEDGRLLQTELHVLEGTDRPFRNLILWPNRSAQKGRMFRIEPDGVGDFFRAEIGVAIVASVPAGVISADVDALDTPARCALVAVFGGAEGTADDPLDQARIDAASVWDAHRL